MSDVGFKKIGKEETDYGTGAHRDKRRGKGNLAWVPWDAMFLVSRIYEEGNIGRSGDGTGHDRNWENGMPIQDLVQSALNHLTAYLAGDRSEPHLPQAAWNTLNAIYMSIQVHMGWRPASLNRLTNQRGGMPNDAPPSPLSPQEIDWLKVRGIEKKHPRHEFDELSGNCPGEKRDEHNPVKEIATGRGGPLC
jgi:hypothetical protein